MLQYEKIDASEESVLDKSSKSKEYMLFHYWYFKNIGYKYVPLACNRCYDVLMTDNLLLDTYELQITVTLNVKGVDYSILQGVTKNDAINVLDNSKLDDKVYYK